MSVSLPIYETLQQLGYALLSLAIVVQIAKESLKLLRGEAVNWLELLLKAGLSISVLMAIPTIGTTIVHISTSIGDAILAAGNAVAVDRAVAKALTTLDCDTGWSVSRTLLSGLAHIVVFLTMIAKLIIIDIGWVVALHLVLYMGVISIPAAVFGGGGVGGYCRALLSVATWPIIFGIVTSIVGGLFSVELGKVANGQAKIECKKLESAGSEREAQLNATSGVAAEKAKHSGVWRVLRFVGVLGVLLLMLLTVPYLGTLVVGESSPGSMMSSMMGSFSKSQRGLSGAAQLAKGAASKGARGGRAGARAATAGVNAVRDKFRR